MGFVRALSPLVLGIARRNPAAGRVAFNALASTTKVGKAVGKAAPYVGTGLTAAGAYAGYNSAVNKGEDPGRAAFKGIGGVVGGALGGLGGGAVGGPVGGFGGYLAGDYAGEKVAGKIYDSLSGGYNQPMPAALTIAEQRAMRSRTTQRRNPNNPNAQGMYDIGGFRYSQGADTGLVGMRMQQQAQNINAMQGYSTAKHLSNNQLRGALGQQSTDRYAVGQMNQTDRLGILQNNITQRYGIGRDADVSNRRTLRDERLGLGEQYTQRYAVGRNAQRDETLGLGGQYTQRYGIARQADVENNRTSANTKLGLGQQYTDRYGMTLKSGNERYGLETSRQLGGRDRDLQQYDLTQGYGLKERQRRDSRMLGMRSLDLRGQELDNSFAINGLNIFSNMYR